MESLRITWAELWSLISKFDDPLDRLYWPYLLSALAAAAIVSWVRRGRSNPRELLRFLFPLRLFWHPSSRLDVKLIFANGLFRMLLASTWAVTAFAMAVEVAVFLDGAFGVPAMPSLPLAVIGLVYTLVLFIVWDASRYAAHRLMHEVSWLWKFHQVHHSAEVLTPLTLYRTHPIESLIMSVRGTLVTGATAGLFYYLFRNQAVQVTVWGINAAGFAFNLAGANLRHSHVWLGFGRWERFFMSPAQHQLHHSSAPEHHNKNLGTFLALWDRLAGTHLESARTERKLSFGLATAELNHRPYSVVSALFAPMTPRSMANKNAGEWVGRAAAKLTTFGLVFLAVSLAAAAQSTTDSYADPASPQTMSEPATAPMSATMPALPAAPPPVTAETAPAEAAPLPLTSATVPAPEIEKTPPPHSLDTIWVIGGPQERARVAGSAHALDEKELERFEYDDVQRVLTQVPGVYVRGEDGYGLRPNIGLRGANSDRSAKVTLMEDGVLLAPAPYAAPAAYYFPLTTRMSGIEVFKGPASIRYGPNTIGGAINMLTRAVPREPVGNIDLAVGEHRLGKLHGYSGTGGKNWGILAEGAHLQTTGFKDLDGGGDTGFDKNELMLKGRVNSDPGMRLYHQLDAKAGYGDERSSETYVGLSGADFKKTPYRRYAASQNDEMDWTRTQAQLGYFLTVGQAFDIRVTGYRNDLDRNWTKINGFRNGPELKDLLANPNSGQAAVFYEVLRGNDDTQNDDQVLLLGSNHRTYVSQGVAAVSHWRPIKGWFSEDIEFGARYHYDRIEREHTEKGHGMQNRTLVPESSPEKLTAKNRGIARAVALHVHDQTGLGNLLLTPGLRVEIVKTDFQDQQARNRIGNADTVLIPGMGVYYQIIRELGVLAGAHKGFSPVSPGQPDNVRPESSVNYEAGARIERAGTKAELIGFFNDYANLTGECTLSSGCPEDLIFRQFNGGRVFVYGAEAAADQKFNLGWGVALQANANYTLTLSKFKTSFTSDNPQFGRVTENDELPYVPKHQATVIVGLSRGPWDTNVLASYVGAMRDLPGQGEIPDSLRIEPHTVVDAALGYQATPAAKLYATVNNVFGASYSLSYRPFGQRPGAPRQAMVGLKYNFFAEAPFEFGP